MWMHFNGKNVEPYITHYELNNPDVVFNTDIKTDYIHIIKSCLELMNTNNIQTEFLVSKMITDLLTLCLTQNNNLTNQKHMEKILLIKDYIDNNFQSKISLSGIAQEFYMSKYYLAREFKKCYCMTIGDYTSGKRITFAKELLRFTNKNIEEISALCGIADTNYFAKIFKKFEGCSPSEYRKKW
jgi:YesN/AraC family two-component response regulator